MALAHNQVEIYGVKEDTVVLLDKVQCQVRCILQVVKRRNERLRKNRPFTYSILRCRYSARFYGTTRADLVLASGTVFNQVHIWKLNDRDEQGDGVVQSRFIGHEGVIFGVRFSPDGSMLASVSDDRTIRVWSVNDQK